MHQIILHISERILKQQYKRSLWQFALKLKKENYKNDIKRKAARILALLLDKTDKYEYLTDEEILASHQRKIIEEAKFTYFPFGKAFEKQIKTT